MVSSLRFITIVHYTTVKTQTKLFSFASDMEKKNSNEKKRAKQTNKQGNPTSCLDSLSNRSL